MPKFAKVILGIIIFIIAGPSIPFILMFAFPFIIMFGGIYLFSTLQGNPDSFSKKFKALMDEAQKDNQDSKHKRYKNSDVDKSAQKLDNEDLCSGAQTARLLQDEEYCYQDEMDYNEQYAQQSNTSSFEQELEDFEKRMNSFGKTDIKDNIKKAVIYKEILDKKY